MDVLKQYQQTKQRLTALNDQLTKYQAVLDTVARQLGRNRLHFMFSNSGSMPMEVGLSSKTVSVDANDFPSANQLQDVLREWHSARERIPRGV